MADIFNTEDSVFFVGGTGTKAGVANPGGCTKAWYDANFTNLTDIMGANGAPLLADTSVNYFNATKSFQKTGLASGITAGMVLYVSGTNITAGLYEVTDVVLPDVVICAGVVSTGDNTDSVVNIGGAYSDLQTAWDDMDASAYNVEIHTNLDETLAATIDLDGAGGAKDIDTWLSVIGVDANGAELTYGNYVDFDAQDNNLGNAIIYIHNVDNVRLKNLHALDNNNGSGSNDNGFRTRADGGNHYNIVFENCNATGCYYGFRSTYESSVYFSVHFIDCKASGNANTVVILSGYGYSVIGCTFVGTSSFVLQCQYGTVVSNCILSGGAYGIYYPGQRHLNVNNCIFYSQSIAGIWLNHSTCKLVEYNNIYLLDGVGDLAIKNTTGTIDYSNYNCAWSASGALTQAWPAGSIGDKSLNDGTSIAVDPLFVDVAGGDFTPRNTTVLRGGKPDIESNITPIGAVFGPQHFSRGSRAFGPGRVSTIRN